MRHPLAVACALGLIIGLPARLPARGVGPSGELPRPIDTDKPAALSLDELKEGIRKRYKDLRALRVVYHQSVRDIIVTTSAIREVDLEFAYKGEKRLASMSRSPKDGGATAGGAEIIAFDGESVRSLIPVVTKPGVPMAFIQGPSGNGGYLDMDAYIQSLAIPLSDRERTRVVKADYFMPDALDAADQTWTVSPTLEIVDGAECHVLQSLQRQSIWIDPSIGFAMRRREMHYRMRDKPMGEWPLYMRISFRDFEKASDSLWLPKAVDIVNYTRPDAPKDRWNLPGWSSSLRVKELMVNDRVADDVFHLSFPPGTNIHDTVRNHLYFVDDAGQEIEVKYTQE